MHEERRVGVPTDRYVNTCRKGFEDFGFDPAVLEEAVAWSTRRVGKEN